MKKMKNVFELPICVFTEDVTDFEGLSLCAVDSNGEYDGAYFWGGCDEEKAGYAARAINHVDALAEALDLLLNDKAMIHASNDKHLQAKAALSAYRGEK